jgi:hypothetical protein
MASKTDELPKCAMCGAALNNSNQSFVLLPGDDVPMAGSRTEIVVSPNECLRVNALACENGHLSFVEAV